MKLSGVSLLIAAACLACSGCARPSRTALEVAPDVSQRRARFVTRPLSAEVRHLTDSDRQALRHLVAAAEEMDEIFWRQAWARNPEFTPKVAALTGPNAEAAKDYYRIMYGRWDRIDELEPFLGTQEHPPGAGFYPQDLSVEEFEDWLEAHPEDVEAFKSLHTVIRRDGEGLVAVPYSEAYREQLEEAAAELRAAAEMTENETLKRFLSLRADAFLSDDYFASDMAWMDLDSPIEIVIGPYETYEDRLFGYKAVFEAFVCVA